MKLPDNFQMREHSWPCRFHISPMCLVDCTSSISCLPIVHVCVCLFLPPLTIITSLFDEMMVTLSLLVSLCTMCSACCRSSGWYKIRNISSATVGHPMNVVPILAPMLLSFCQNLLQNSSELSSRKWSYLPLKMANSVSVNRNYSAILATLQITSYIDSRNSS